MYRIRQMAWLGLAIAILLVAAPTGALAQEAEEAPQPFAYGIYYECPTGTQAQADHIMKHLFKPVYDQAVEDGTITGWGWMSHAIGGKWRRVAYMIAPTLDGVIEASNTLNGKVAEVDPLGVNQLQELCPSHDDYIWRRVAGSGGGADITEQRAETAMSTYWVCDMSKEAQLDELVSEKLAPLWDAQVEAGNLASWSWFQHSIGGKYRRLASQTGKDFASITKARETVIGALVNDHPEVMAEFSSICYEHQDYLWTVELETP